MGKLNMNIIPVDQDGESEIPEENIPESPEELVGQRIDFVVEIKNAADLPADFCKDVYCEYTFFIGEEKYPTVKILGKCQNPQFDFKFHHTVDYCSETFIEYLLKETLCIKVYGYPDLKAKEDKSKQTAKKKKAQNANNKSNLQRSRGNDTTQESSQNSFDGNSIRREFNVVEEKGVDNEYLNKFLTHEDTSSVYNNRSQTTKQKSKPPKEDEMQEFKKFANQNQQQQKGKKVGGKPNEKDQKAHFYLSQSDKCKDLKKIAVTYQDYEGDWITIKTDQELLDAITEQQMSFNRQFVILKIKQQSINEQMKSTYQQQSSGNITPPHTLAIKGFKQIIQCLIQNRLATAPLYHSMDFPLPGQGTLKFEQQSKSYNVKVSDNQQKRNNSQIDQSSITKQVILNFLTNLVKSDKDILFNMRDNLIQSLFDNVNGAEDDTISDEQFLAQQQKLLYALIDFEKGDTGETQGGPLKLESLKQKIERLKKKDVSLANSLGRSRMLSLSQSNSSFSKSKFAGGRIDKNKSFETPHDDPIVQRNNSMPEEVKSDHKVQQQQQKGQAQMNEQNNNNFKKIENSHIVEVDESMEISVFQNQTVHSIFEEDA